MDITAKGTAEMVYRNTVSSLNVASQIRYTPVGGIINRVTISWPRGCNFLVEVLFNHRTVTFLPTPVKGGTGTRGIALDNFTETLNPSWPVERGDPVEMYLINHDNTYSHTISAIVHISTGGEFFR